MPFKYPRRHASALIHTSYEQCGLNSDLSSLLDSYFEKHVSKIPPCDNEGFFRFLDEAIHLLEVFHFQSLLGAKQDSTKFAESTLIFGLQQSAIAVRFLESYGLDSPARQNLRVLHEQCAAWVRYYKDSEFKSGINNTKSIGSSNEFWYQYFAKNRMNKFFQNADMTRLCEVFRYENFDSARKLLGVAGHPNVFSFLNPMSKHLSTPLDQVDAFGLLSENSTEFVLSHSVTIILSAISCCSEILSQTEKDMSTLKVYSVFNTCETAREAFDKIGRAAALMFLFLVMLTNRGQPDFDASTHF